MAFCIAVESNISTDVCPLGKGRCYWQHRETQYCKYTEQDLSLPEFAELVGVSLPSEQQIAEFKDQLRSKL